MSKNLDLKNLLKRINITSINDNNLDYSTSSYNISDISDISDQDNENDKFKKGKENRENDKSKNYYRDDKIINLEVELSSIKNINYNLEDNIKTLNLKLSSTVNTYENLISKIKLSTSNEINNLKLQLENFNNNGPILQEKLNISKNDLADLSLTDDMYCILKNINDNNKSLKEYVLTKVYEREKAIHSFYNPLKNECNTWKEKFLELEHKYTANEIYHARQLKTLMEQKQDLEKDHEATVIYNKKYVEEISELQLKVASMKALNDETKNIDSKLKTLQAEHDEALQEQRINGISLKSCIDEKENLSKKNLDNESIISILKMDKAYLTRENDSQESRIKELSRERDSLNTTVAELKISKDELYSKLVENRNQNQLNYEQKLSDEIEKISNRSKSELEEIRVRQCHTFEREIKSLKDHRDTILIEVEKAQTSFKDKSAQYDSLLLEFKQFQIKLQGEASELRSLLKIKSFDLDRLQLVHEDTLRDYREKKNEVEKVEAKFEVLRTDYYALQNESTKRISTLSCELEALKDKLTIYQAWEAELCNDGFNSDPLPRQNVLASKLMEKHTRLTNQSKKIAHLEEQEMKLTEQLKACQAQMHLVQQPYNYLIDSIQNRDDKIAKQQLQITQAHNELKLVTDELKNVTARKQEIEREFEKILQTRNNVELLKNLLTEAKSVSKLSLPLDKISIAPEKVNIIKRGGGNENISPNWLKQLKK